MFQLFARAAIAMVHNNINQAHSDILYQLSIINYQVKAMRDGIDGIFSLKNRVIVVTGACGLLGRMYLESIVKHDSIPVLLDLSMELLKKFLDKLSGAPSYLNRCYYSN